MSVTHARSAGNHHDAQPAKMPHFGQRRGHDGKCDGCTNRKGLSRTSTTQRRQDYGSHHRTGTQAGE
jgi:hypothetical protein